MVDSLINGNIPELEILCDLIAADKDLKVFWGGKAAIRPEMTPRLLKKLFAAGNRSIVYGVESGADRVLKEMRKNFTFSISSQVDGGYKVRANCSDRATVLLKNIKANVPVNEWFDSYQSVIARDFVLEGPTSPVIGVGLDSSPTAVSFLRGEGYIVEPSDKADHYAKYFNNLAQFSEADEKTLSREIEQSDAPLLRYWRWPDQAKSALSVTGDIDSMTLIDFALRILENWRPNVK